jgi:hypothetical protein
MKVGLKNIDGCLYGDEFTGSGFSFGWRVMNFSCPNQIDGHCEKLEKPCHPVQAGCVLEGKVKVIGKEKKPAPPLNTGESD